MNHSSSLLFVFVCVASFTGAAQTNNCNGSFLFYNHNGWFTGNFDCYTCGETFTPVVAIKEPLTGRWSYIWYSITKIGGGRMGVPINPGYHPFAPALIYINNALYWGNTLPMWMGITFGGWYLGQQQYVSVLAASVPTDCQYQDSIQVHAYAKTYIPGVGDTCYYDSVWTFPHCAPLAHIEAPGPSLIAPVVVDTLHGFDITGRATNKRSGLVCLLMWDGVRYYTKKIYYYE